MSKVSVDIEYIKVGLKNIGYEISDCLERTNNGTNWQIKFSNSGAIITIYDSNRVHNTVINGKQRCERCGKIIEIMDISDSTVIREFHENYWLSKNGNCDHYDEDGQFAVLCRYSEFMSNPDIFINKAYEKTKHPIARQVHFSDIKHKYRRYW